MNRTNEKRIDARFRQALNEIAADENGALMRDAAAGDNGPSAALTDSIRAMLDEQEQAGGTGQGRRWLANAYRAISKVAVWLLLVLLAAAIVTPRIGATRQLLFRLISRADEKADTYYLAPQETPVSRGVMPRSLFVPARVPAGFVLVEHTYSLVEERLLYVAEDDQFIHIQVMNDTNTLSVDNERMERQYAVDVNGHPADFSYKDGTSRIVWTQNNLLILLVTTLPPDKAMALAGNMSGNN